MRAWWIAAALAAVAGLAESDQTIHDGFDELVAEYERFRAESDPIRSGRRGDLSAAARWPDASRQAVAARNRREAEFLARLDEIDPGALDSNREASYIVLDYLLRSATRLAPFEPERIPFTNDSGFFSTPLTVAASMRLASVDAAEAWLKRLDALPTYLAQHQAWLKKGIDDGFVQPRYVVEQVLEQLEAIAAMAPARSPLMAPFDTLPPGVDRTGGPALRARGLALVEDRVLPAYAELIKFMRQRYLAAARESIGISAVPRGRAYYRALVEYHTTLDTTPKAIHERGRTEVARIRAEMEALIDELDFDGDFAAFLSFMRTDERFYADSEEELLREAAWIAKRADDAMPELFGRLPRLPYGVRAVPAHMAPTYTTGRYWPGDSDSGVAGGYMVNTHALDQRPLYALPALTLHEAVPGHHHQIALSQEMADLPQFRRDTYITAFGEGWGLYAERLGVEMGIYTTPYEHFGRLTYEMWRACRLVVDTGIHYFDFSREQAEACLLENSALAPHNVRTEVARYIAFPGQALAYKPGELLIRDLRARAESELGTSFDIRAFHDHLLAEGAMPLNALSRRMTAWIEARASER